MPSDITIQKPKKVSTAINRLIISIDERPGTYIF